MRYACRSKTNVDMELPKDFVAEFDGLAEALLEEPSVSVRRNMSKTDSFDDGADADTVPWCEAGLYLSERPQFTFDPSLHQGLYYVQDASSMIYSHIVGRLTASGTPVAYLDACAAPGGKTTAAIDALPKGSLVVANEFVPARAQTLKENLIKWGSPAVVVSKGDTRRFRKLPAMFDIVAADVPCSGEGMFRKDPEAVRQWTPALVEECASRQREIIDNLWDAIAPGGYLIYSTCTFNRSENEDMVGWILDNYDCESAAVDMPEEWGTVEREGCRHFLPGRVRGEGLTVAVIRKSEGCPGRHRTSSIKPVKESSADKKILDQCRSWLLSPDSFVFELSGSSVYAFPKPWYGTARELDLKLDVIYRGIEVGSVKGRDIIPSQSLALSRAFDSSAFPSCEVDYPTAVAYLRRESMALPEGVARGFVLLTYGGRPLGFVKNIGNRANNLYPNEWRILSTYVPAEAPAVLVR